MSGVFDFSSISEKEKNILSIVRNIGGHLTDTEIIALYRISANLPDNAKILEIGSYRGRSSNAIGHAIYKSNKELYCLDIWKDYNVSKESALRCDSNTHNIEPTDFGVLKDFLKNTNWFSDNLRILKGSTSMFKDLLPNNFFDLIFIDGAHDYDNVYFDIKQALVSLKAGSILCGHDYHSQGVGVIKAVNELVFQNPNTRSHATIPETSLWIATFN